MIEAKKLAYADLSTYIGDPRQQKLPVATLLSKEWAEKRAKLIDAEHANCAVAAGDTAGRQRHDLPECGGPGREHGVVDSEQLRRVWFGDCGRRHGIRTARSRRHFSRSIPRHPMHWRDASARCTPSFPAFAQKGDTRIAFGIMGGWNQSQAHAQFVANVSDFKMNIQAALEAPRFSKRTFDGCDVSLENRFNGKVRDELAAKGHKIDLKGAFSSVMGGGQAVLRDYAAGVNYGASDPRKDGQAAAELAAE